MKKKILITTVILAALFTGYGVIIRKAGTEINVSTDRQFDQHDFKKFLNSAGFKKVPEVVKYNSTSEKAYWFNKYGLYFLTHQEMKTLCDSNNFIIGPADAYKESVPDSSAFEMMQNYNKIKNDMCCYFVNNWHTRTEMWFTDNELKSDVKNMRWQFSNIEFNSSDENLINHVTKKGNDVIINVYNLEGLTDYECVKLNDFTKIKVVADIRKFDKTGLTVKGNELIKPKTDPMAVIQHRNGYIILTRWN